MAMAIVRIRHPYITLAIILVLSACVFLPTIQFEFTNWDDDIHVTNNPHVQDFSLRSAVYHFTSTTNYMYHPITMISYMVDWNLSGGKPWLFHLTNVIIHLVNIVLLFFLLQTLRSEEKITTFILIVFALYPLQVESVAWISGRKELLYVFFFLVSLLLYSRYWETKQCILIIYSLIAFMLSLLSKPSAIILPGVLVALEYVRRKRISVEVLKIPALFLLVAVVYGILFLQTQQSTSLRPIEYFPLEQRMLLLLYELSFYIWKFLLPVYLSACYAYPEVDALPPSYVVIPVMISVLILLASVFTRYRNAVIFGMMLYVITIFPVLQVIPFHNASLVADRYIYLPIVAIALFVGYGIRMRSEETDHLSLTLNNILMVFLTLVLSATTLNRVFVWKDSITLFSDMIAKNPKLAIAYGNRAYAKILKNDFNGAIEDCNVVLRLNLFDGKAYYNKGNAYSQLNKFDSAVICYTSAMQNGFTTANIFYNRGNAFYKLGNSDSAIADYHRALLYSPQRVDIYFNLGYVYLSGKKDYKKAVAYFDSVLVHKPDSFEAYFFRAESFYHLQQYKNAFNDITSAAAFNKRISQTHLYFQIDSVLRNVTFAIDSLTLLLEKNPKRIDLLKKRALLYFQIQDSVSGMEDLSRIPILSRKQSHHP